MAQYSVLKKATQNYNKLLTKLLKNLKKTAHTKKSMINGLVTITKNNF